MQGDDLASLVEKLDVRVVRIQAAIQCEACPWEALRSWLEAGWMLGPRCGMCWDQCLCLVVSLFGSGDSSRCCRCPV